MKRRLIPRTTSYGAEQKFTENAFTYWRGYLGVWNHVQTHPVDGSAWLCIESIQTRTV